MIGLPPNSVLFEGNLELSRDVLYMSKLVLPLVGEDRHTYINRIREEIVTRGKGKGEWSQEVNGSSFCVSGGIYLGFSAGW